MTKNKKPYQVSFQALFTLPVLEAELADVNARQVDYFLQNDELDITRNTTFY